MFVDPVIVVAQIINFLILVTLLKHFLYGPIVHAMNQREQAIADRLAEAEQREQEAELERKRFRQMQQDFVAHRDQRLDQLRSQLNDQRITLLEQAKKDVDIAKVQWYTSLEQEKQTVLRTIRQQVAYQIVQTLQKILTDITDADLDQQMTNIFLKRFNTLSESDQKSLQVAISHAKSSPIIIRSSFPIDNTTQQRLKSKLQAIIRQDANLQFEQDDAFSYGIELRLPGYKLDWTLSTYLTHLEHQLAILLEEQIDRAEPSTMSYAVHS